MFLPMLFIGHLFCISMGLDKCYACTMACLGEPSSYNGIAYPDAARRNVANLTVKMAQSEITVHN